MIRHLNVAAYTGTRNLYKLMVPAVKSLLINSNVDKIYLLIEDDEFPYELPKQVECINVSGQKYFKPDGPNMDSRFTYMAMIRATYAHLFPNLDRILSLDVDTIVDKDISALWDIDLDDCYFAAVIEPDRSDVDEDILYTNIGVALYNLEMLRDGKADEVIKALNEKKYSFLEQDAFNEFCQGHIRKIPSIYNATNYTAITRNPHIVHYAGMKKWGHIDLVQQYAKASWEEIAKHRARKEMFNSECGNREKKSESIVICRELLSDSNVAVQGSDIDQGNLRSVHAGTGSKGSDIRRAPSESD